MKNLRRFALPIFLLAFLFSACAAPALASAPTPADMAATAILAPINTTTAVPPTATFVPTSTSTPGSTATQGIPPTMTPQLVNQPGLIATIDDSSSPVFSPDGRVLALIGSRIRLWDIQTQQVIRELKSPDLSCSMGAASFSPDNHLFAVTKLLCNEDENNAGHLLVWDVATGDLLQDWSLNNAKMPAPNSYNWDYTIPVYSLAFQPNSKTLVFANGNTLEIRDVFQKDKVDVLKLGPKMFASQISLSSDGRLAYVIMSWEKDHNFPSLWTYQHKFQIWNINTHAMLREIKYPEGWVTMRLELLGTSLIHVDFENNTSQITNLETDKVKDLPFRKGWRYYNSDASLMIYARLFGFDDKDMAIELWRTDDWRNIYTFMPDFGPDWAYGMNGIVFSPDNTMLAIQHGSQVSLWNIRPFVQP